MCLLNIPKQIQNFGSVFHHWEGSGLGEKIVQVAKRHFHSFRKNWHTNLIQRIVKYHTMSILCSCEIEEYDLQDNDHSHNNVRNEKLGIYAYKCSATPTQHLIQHKPVAFVELTSGNFAIKLDLNFHLKLYYTSYIGEICGLHYFTWELEEECFEG